MRYPIDRVLERFQNQEEKA